jgi:hypothetical protein
MPSIVLQDEIHFDLGTVLHLERRLEDKSLRGSSKIIGAHEPRYLMVDMPTAYGKPMMFLTGEKCVVRFLHKGSLLGFKADVLKVISDPFPMMLLEYPKTVEALKLRKEERLECNLDCALSLLPFSVSTPQPKAAEGDPEPVLTEAPMPTAALRGFICDLTTGGCQVSIIALDPGNYSRKIMELRREMPVEERAFYHSSALKESLLPERTAFLDFELPQPAPGAHSLVACEIRWVIQQGFHHNVGVRFREPSSHLQESIQAIIEHQQRYFMRHFDTTE